VVGYEQDGLACRLENAECSGTVGGVHARFQKAERLGFCGIGGGVRTTDAQRRKPKSRVWGEIGELERYTPARAAETRCSAAAVSSPRARPSQGLTQTTASIEAALETARVAILSWPISLQAFRAR